MRHRSIVRAAGGFGLALLLIACEGDDLTAASPAKSGTLNFRDCEEQTALLLAAPDSLPPLPDEFRYGQVIPGLPMAGIHISGSRCADVNGEGPTQDVLAFALIEPPEHLKSEGVTAYGIILGGYAQRAVTAAGFDSWGMTGVVRTGEVDWQLDTAPLLRLGAVDARGEHGGISTRIEAIGPEIQPGGGLTRAFHFVDGRVVASIDAFYTPQTGMLGTGLAWQTGDGPLPASFSVATGSHAWDYDLELRNPQRY